MSTSIDPIAAEPSALERFHHKRRPLLRRVLARLGLQSKLVLAFMGLVSAALFSSCWLYVHDSTSRIDDLLTNEARQTASTLSLASEAPLLYNERDRLRRLGEDLIRSRNVAYINFFDTSGKLVVTCARDERFRPDSSGKVAASSLMQVMPLNVPLFDDVLEVTWPILRGSDAGQGAQKAAGQSRPRPQALRPQALLPQALRPPGGIAQNGNATAPIALTATGVNTPATDGMAGVVATALTATSTDAPVDLDTTASDGQMGVLGYVQVAVAKSAAQSQIDHVKYVILGVGGVLLALCLPLAYLLVHRIFLPIRELVTATRSMASGNFETRVDARRPDVIGELARSFNDMVKQVHAQQGELKKANGRLADGMREMETMVDQRTHQLETANRRLSTEIAEKEDFLRAVSHDLNAPLRNISGMVSMLLMKKKDSFDEDVIHRLERIKKNVEVETDLITELLELSRIKTRRQSMELVAIEAMVWDLRGMFENDLKTHGIDLILDSNLPALNCERARVRQVFQNLIDNAIKYMGEGTRREIHVGCYQRLSEAQFYVRDTGMGIDPEDVDKVFHVFRRGKNPAMQNISGKGVGLASVKSIVETYSGKIWVESRVGEGSCFHFTINGQYVPNSNGYVRPMDDRHAAAMAG